MFSTTSNKKVGRKLDNNTGKYNNSYRIREIYFHENLSYKVQLKVALAARSMNSEYFIIRKLPIAL